MHCTENKMNDWRAEWGIKLYSAAALVKRQVKVIISFSENLDLIDAWRVLNPDSSRFTWRQKKPEIHRRLDFFLHNQCIFCNTIDAEVLAGYKTDHSMTTLQIYAPTLEAEVFGN